MQKRDINKLVELFRALGDQTRVTLMAALREHGEQCVMDLRKRLRMPQPTISHHLAILRERGLVNARRAGKYVFYSVDETQAEWLSKTLEPLLRARSGGKRRRGSRKP